MDFVLLVGVMIVVVAVLSVVRVRSQPTVDGSDPSPKVVRQNLDYSILGQRPEIVTEDDGDA